MQMKFAKCLRTQHPNWPKTLLIMQCKLIMKQFGCFLMRNCSVFQTLESYQLSLAFELKCFIDFQKYECANVHFQFFPEYITSFSVYMYQSHYFFFIVDKLITTKNQWFSLSSLHNLWHSLWGIFSKKIKILSNSLSRILCSRTRQLCFSLVLK